MTKISGKSLEKSSAVAGSFSIKVITFFSSGVRRVIKALVTLVPPTRITLDIFLLTTGEPVTLKTDKVSSLSQMIAISSPCLITVSPKGRIALPFL